MQDTEKAFVARNHNLDLLRIMAMTGVVIIHAAAPLVLSSTAHDSKYATAIAYDAFSRFCVPIFIMISGSLMFSFGKDIDENPWKYYTKKVKRFLPTILFWILFYFAFTGKVGAVLFSTNPAELLEGLKNIALTGVPYYHLWYIYMLPGLFFFAPLLMFLKRKVTSKQWLAIGIGLLIFGMIHNALRQFQGWSLLPMVEFLDFLGYLILGDILLNKKFSRSWLLCTFIGGSALLAFAMFFSFRSYFASFLSPFVLIPSISLYLLINQGVSFAKSRFLYDIALSSFGIYLIHAAIIDTLMKWTNFSLTSFAYVDIFFYTIITILISCIVVKILRSIKWLKWIV